MSLSPTNSLPILTPTEIPIGIRQAAAGITFRQSFLKDYISCPQMAMYRWLCGFDEAETFFSAVMGSAGHKVIYDFHSERLVGHTGELTDYSETLSRFNTAFEEQLNKEKYLPKIGNAFDTLLEQRDSLSDAYVTMLQGYLRHVKNSQFHSTLHEQSFVLVVNLPGAGVSGAGDSLPFIFTGTIDQGGYYSNGTFALRDIKFRENTFRPSKIMLDLDTQITLYAFALRYGRPACDSCKPEFNEFSNSYTDPGPCSVCAAKVGTTAWPQMYPEICEVIWMRDFIKYKKDEFSREIPDKTRKVKNPATGRMVNASAINPKWMEGYKAGDYKGPGFMPTSRSADFLSIQMSDILRICQQIRSGVFYRKPGEQCSFWCKHRETCLNSLELQMDEINIGEGSAFATADPFSD